MSQYTLRPLQEILRIPTFGLQDENNDFYVSRNKLFIMIRSKRLKFLVNDMTTDQLITVSPFSFVLASPM